MKRFTLALALALTLSAGSAQATTCGNAPAGAVVTPDCTYVVSQSAPGFWLDNLKQLWTLVLGQAVKVMGAVALPVGR